MAALLSHLAPLDKEGNRTLETEAQLPTGQFFHFYLPIPVPRGALGSDGPCSKFLSKNFQKQMDSAAVPYPLMNQARDIIFL